MLNPEIEWHSHKYAQIIYGQSRGHVGMKIQWNDQHLNHFKINLKTLLLDNRTNIIRQNLNLDDDVIITSYLLLRYMVPSTTH